LWIIIVIVLVVVFITAVPLILIAIRYQRKAQRAKQQRKLNEESERIGLRNLDSLDRPAGDARIIVGGVYDPELGEGRVYKTTTHEEIVSGDDNLQRRVKTITEDTGILGKQEEGLEMEVKTVPRKLSRRDWDVQPDNPLYASQEYLSDFNNPLYDSAPSSQLIKDKDYENNDDDRLPLVQGDPELGIKPVSGRPAGRQRTILIGKRESSSDEMAFAASEDFHDYLSGDTSGAEKDTAM
jgi:hypothetical protein